MAGGLIEGFQKLFKGKNVLQKHLFLFGLGFLLCVEIGLKNPVLYFLCSIVTSLLFGLYFMHFTHNAVKYCVYRDHEDDYQKVKAIQIMPEINKGLFEHTFELICFVLAWGLVFGIIYLCLLVPILGFIVAIASIPFVFCWNFTAGIIFARFAETYQIKGNVSIGKVFSYLPKVILSVLILDLKIFCLSLPIIGIVYLISMLVFGLSSEDNRAIFIYMLLPFVAYTIILITMAYQYEIANIYYRDVKLTEEI